MNGKRRRRRRKRKENIYKIILCGLVFFVYIGTAFCMKVESDNKRKAIAEQKEQAAQKEIEEKKKERAAAEEKEAALDQREALFAVQPGNPVGVFEQSQEKVVYLTFDDGPSNKTQAVLDILDQYNVKATFFVTGAMPEYHPLIKTAYEKGHTIGLHTYSHDYQQVYASTDAYFQDLNAIGQVVKEQIGYVPCFIRFPGGSSNTISANYCQGIMSALASMVEAQGYQYYDWNCSSGDGSVRTAEELVQGAASCSENNIIVLCHDSTTKQTTIDALPQIIEHFQSQGYVFRAIDRSSYVVHHGIGN